jgi:hypothetical protein
LTRIRLSTSATPPTSSAISSARNFITRCGTAPLIVTRPRRTATSIPHASTIASSASLRHTSSWMRSSLRW